MHAWSVTSTSFAFFMKASFACGMYRDIWGHRENPWKFFTGTGALTKLHDASIPWTPLGSTQQPNLDIKVSWRGPKVARIVTT